MSQPGISLFAFVTYLFVRLEWEQRGYRVAYADQVNGCIFN